MGPEEEPSDDRGGDGEGQGSRGKPCHRDSKRTLKPITVERGFPGNLGVLVLPASGLV